MHGDAPVHACRPLREPVPTPLRNKRAPRSPSASAAAAGNVPRPAPPAAPSPFAARPDRANCRFERFAHTINITTPTAQASTNRAGLTRPLTRCCQRHQDAARMAFRSGCWLCSCFPSIVSSACAPCTVAPGFSLPMTFIVFPVGFVLSFSGQGIKISTGVPGAKTLAEIEGRRQHAHHRHGPVVQSQLPAHDVGVCSEPPPPKAVAQQHGRRSGISPLALLGGERSSDCGLHTQQREEVPGHGNACETLRLAGSGQLPIARHHKPDQPGQIGERPVQFPEVRIVFGLGAGPVVAVGNPYQPSWIAKRERAQ